MTGNRTAKAGIFVLLVGTLFNGCALFMEMKDPPVPIQAKPVVVSVPKIKQYEERFLRGLSFSPASESSNEERVSFTENPRAGELVTKVCKGHMNLNKNGSTVFSCLDYYSKVQFEEKADRVNISFQPYQAIGTKAHDDFFIPHDAPQINVGRLRALLTATSFSFTEEYESQYTPEAIKANFDRKLEGAVDQRTYNNTRQFANSYHLGSMLVRANFYPHKSGSAIELMVDGSKPEQVKDDLVDWATPTFEAKKALASLVHN